ncbi:hypothetical protein PROAA_530010 [Candidatus Propionivibrio aalborgensis]|uniref:Uncharacterized protein n=1 Tax=Candidatus Propionivibrio aalborgensis TaxID=1860101 RepID=A0A1A8Y0M1_9RHOO|nr:hypothetical protein PROAA_530010 [Candidatus Propionivibrio aalborgensis]
MLSGSMQCARVGVSLDSGQYNESWRVDPAVSKVVRMIASPGATILDNRSEPSSVQYAAIRRHRLEPGSFRG